MECSAVTEGFLLDFAVHPKRLARVSTYLLTRWESCSSRFWRRPPVVNGSCHNSSSCLSSSIQTRTFETPAITSFIAIVLVYHLAFADLLVWQHSSALMYQQDLKITYLNTILIASLPLAHKIYPQIFTYLPNNPFLRKLSRISITSQAFPLLMNTDFHCLLCEPKERINGCELM